MKILRDEQLPDCRPQCNDGLSLSPISNNTRETEKIFEEGTKLSRKRTSGSGEK